MNALLISWMCVSANVLMIWALIRSFDSFEKSSKPGVTIRPWLSLSLRHSISIDSHPRSLQNRYKTFHWTEQKQIKLWKQQTINLRWAYCVRIFFGFEISSHNETTDNFRRHYTMEIILIWLTWQLFKPCICSGECVFMMIVLFVKSQYKHSPVDRCLGQTAEDGLTQLFDRMTEISLYCTLNSTSTNTNGISFWFEKALPATKGSCSINLTKDAR